MRPASRRCFLTLYGWPCPGTGKVIYKNALMKIKKECGGKRQRAIEGKAKSAKFHRGNCSGSQVLVGITVLTGRHHLPCILHRRRFLYQNRPTAGW